MPLHFFHDLNAKVKQLIVFSFTGLFLCLLLSCSPATDAQNTNVTFSIDADTAQEILYFAPAASSRAADFVTEEILQKTKISVSLTGDYEETQTKTFSITGVSFSFNKIPIGAKLSAKAEVYYEITDGIKVPVASGESSSITVKEGKNRLSLELTINVGKQETTDPTEPTEPTEPAEPEEPDEPEEPKLYEYYDLPVNDSWHLSAFNEYQDDMVTCKSATEDSITFTLNRELTQPNGMLQVVFGDKAYEEGKTYVFSYKIKGPVPDGATSNLMNVCCWVTKTQESRFSTYNNTSPTETSFSMNCDTTEKGGLLFFPEIPGEYTISDVAVIEVDPSAQEETECSLNISIAQAAVSEDDSEDMLGEYQTPALQAFTNICLAGYYSGSVEEQEIFYASNFKEIPEKIKIMSGQWSFVLFANYKGLSFVEQKSLYINKGQENSLSFTLSAGENSHFGGCDINFSWTDPDISKVLVTLKKDNQNGSVILDNVPLEIMGETQTKGVSFKRNLEEEAERLASGKYFITFDFYKESFSSGDTLVRQYDGVLFIKDALTTSAEIPLTFIEIEKTLYLAANGDDNQNDGLTEETPFVTLAKACQTIIQNGNSNLDWIIKIKGELDPESESEILSEITSEYAKSIILTGASGLDEQGIPQDALKRNKAGSSNSVSNGTVLKVSTSVPVTITDLKITGGYGFGQSAGGITIAQGATVSLGNGALIIGNRNGSNGRGGGIHNEGTLFMYGSAVVGDKTNGGKTNVENYTYGSDSSSYNPVNCANYATSGGGIFNGNYGESTVQAKLYLGYKCGENSEPEKEVLTGGLYYNGGSGGALYNAGGSIVYFDSGNIEWNGSATNGGAIFNAAGATVEMTGGSILNNSSKNGNVYNEENTSTFIMSGGKMNNNTATENGGAVCNNGRFFMNGSAIIGDETVTEVADSKTNTFGNKAGGAGGAIYNYVNTASSQNGQIYIGYTLDSNDEPVKQKLIGGIYFNLATTYGGAIDSNGILKIASGTIAYNSSSNSGGAIRSTCTTSQAFEATGGSIYNNAAVTNGGAIFISGNKAGLYLGGSVEIPWNEEKKRNDIYLAGTSDYCARIYISSALSQSLQAAITPESYSEGRQLIFSNAGEAIALATQAGYFDVRPQLVTDASNGDQMTIPWGFDEQGSLKKLIYGSKPAPNAIGDIVFSDGSAIPYAAGLVLTDEQRSHAIAVIFYDGSQTQASEQKILGVGLKRSESTMAWCSSAAKANNVSISEIVTTPDVPNGLATSFDGDLDGSDNFEKISDYLKTNNLDDDTETEGMYPAFEFARNYKEQLIGSETASRLTGTDFEEGWYLPALYELYCLYICCQTVDNAISLCGGVQLGTESYWSSNQHNAEAARAFGFAFGSGNNGNNYKSAGGGGYVCVIRQFF